MGEEPSFRREDQRDVVMDLTDPLLATYDGKFASGFIMLFNGSTFVARSSKRLGL